MTESIKNRMGGSHIGKMNDKELRKLFLATLADMQNLVATVNNLVTDVQKISNNTNAANNTVQVTGTAVTLTLAS